MNALDSIKEELKDLKKITEELNEVGKFKAGGCCDKCYMYPSILYRLAQQYYNLLIKYEMTDNIWMEKTKIMTSCKVCSTTKEKERLQKLLTEIHIKLAMPLQLPGIKFEEDPYGEDEDYHRQSFMRLDPDRKNKGPEHRRPENERLR